MQVCSAALLQTRFILQLRSLVWRWIQFKKSLSLTDLQKKAQAKGLFIPMTCLYQNRTVTALRLGFATHTLQKMEEAMQLLEETYFEVIQNI